LLRQRRHARDPSGPQDSRQRHRRRRLDVVVEVWDPLCTPYID
jgi:hypothetical protein